MLKTLSEPALNIIENYKNLKIGNKTVDCPYFNNKHNFVRAGLRVLIGKGSPDEIEQEAMLFAFREKCDLLNLDKEALKKFLVDHNLGIDCSGLAYYILNAEIKYKTKKTIKKYLKFPMSINPLRYILRKLRPAENVNATVLADDKNSKVVDIKNLQPGDLIILLNSDGTAMQNHVLIIHAVEKDGQNKIKTIFYTHAMRWSSDGKYNHGIKQGQINITDTSKNILEQEWKENETFSKAESSQICEIRRIIPLFLDEKILV
jgi:hypothetical protein